MNQLTVLCSVFDDERISRAIRSVYRLIEYGADIDLIIGLDGSPDSVVDVIQKTLKELPKTDKFRAGLLKFPKAFEIGEAKNRIVRAALGTRGRYFTFVDSDDELLPPLVSQYLPEMIEKDLDIVRPCILSDFLGDYHADDPLLWAASFSNSPCGMIFNKRIIPKDRPFFHEAFPCVEDMMTWMRLSLEGIHVCPIARSPAAILHREPKRKSVSRPVGVNRVSDTMRDRTVRSLFLEYKMRRISPPSFCTQVFGDAALQEFKIFYKTFRHWHTEPLLVFTDQSAAIYEIVQNDAGVTLYNRVDPNSHKGFIHRDDIWQNKIAVCRSAMEVYGATCWVDTDLIFMGPIVLKDPKRVHISFHTSYRADYQDHYGVANGGQIYVPSLTELSRWYEMIEVIKSDKRLPEHELMAEQRAIYMAFANDAIIWGKEYNASFTNCYERLWISSAKGRIYFDHHPIYTLHHHTDPRLHHEWNGSFHKYIEPHLKNALEHPQFHFYQCQQSTS